MRIGALRRKFDLQRQQVNDGEVQWTTVSQTWAQLRSVSKDATIAHGIDARITHLATMRYRADVELEPGMRLVSGEKCFLVHRVTNIDEANMWFYALVQEAQTLGEG